MSGLQHLIDFVLNEVALCGDQGARISDVLQKIDEFYQTQDQNRESPKQKVDHRLKKKIWTWLANNPEVSVGENNEWNHLTLDEATEVSSEKSHHRKPSRDEGAESEPVPSSIRIFVSRERSWLAVTGHAPDDSKVVPLEFALLSIIASRKSKGIAQPDLVKLSGQDKRSVPKRTDALQRKGYIDKRPIQTKSARTSLCTLQRFLNSKETVDQPQDEGQTAGDEENSTVMIDFDSFNNKLFDILREHQIIAREDLKRKLGFNDKWRWKVLSRAVRKWERIGVLKRVRAESQYEKLHPCIKLEREPTSTDIDLFHEFDFEVLSKHGVEKAGAAIPGGQDQEGEDYEAPAQDGNDIDTSKEQTGPLRRIVPTWTPDRSLNNQMFDVINGTGTAGITNMKLMRVCFGLFFKRPAENLVHRLVDFWQIAQPLHLRHFAVVRDMAMSKTIMFYIHYSATNFANIVEGGSASWEAVEFPSNKAKSLKVKLPPWGAAPQLDEYGFPANSSPSSLLKNPSSTLRDGMAIVKPADYKLSSSDPFVVKLSNGEYVVRRRQDELPAGAKPVHVRPKPTGPTATGRPRGRPTLAMLAQRSKEAKGAGPSENGIEIQPSEPNKVELQGEDEVEEMPPPKRVKRKHPDFRGMSRKEKLEALGMDENWTEYNALLMNKPTPGIYVTPHGRRRPAGKARGRPRQSRIAVFKSPQLSSFTWFIKDEQDSDNENDMDHATLTPGPSYAPSSASAPKTSSPAKRTHSTQSLKAPSSSASDFHQDGVKTERPSKRPCLSMTPAEGSQEDMDITMDSVPGITPAVPEDANGATSTRSPDKSLGIHHLSDADKPAQTPSKRRRTLVSWLSNSTDASPHRPGPADSQQKKISPAPSRTKNQPTLSRRIPRGLRGRDLTEDEQKLLVAPKPLIERGGSISLLRRKVLMEIMDLAGGAYPAGAVVWYPFVTLWMKKGNKEKPDMKTVKNACKQLIDSGHLRQLTFSGRDNKGAMVTKTLLIKPDMSPDHPVVKEMQRKFLAMDSNEPRPGFCDNVEIDHLLTRSSGRPHGDPPRRQKFTFPVERGVHFNLQQKPASIRNEERRKTDSIQKKFLRGLHIKQRIEERIAAQIAAAEEQEQDLPGVKRLMTLSRPPALDTHATGQTSIMRPYVNTRKREPRRLRNPIIRANRMSKPISTIGPYAMLMRPPQHFHLASGTFSTGSCSLKKKPRYTQPVVHVGDPVSELNKLIEGGRDLPHGPESFDRRAEQILKWELRYGGVFDKSLQGQQYIDQTVEGDFEHVPIGSDIRFMPELQPNSRTFTRRSPKPFEDHTAAQRDNQFITESDVANTTESAMFEAQKRKSKQRRATRSNVDRRLAKLDETPKVTATPEKEAQSTPRQRFRRNRFVRSLSDELIRNIMVAIVAVRVLAGGADSRVIDWQLVSKAFPDQDPAFIDSRARQILNKHRLQMTKMQRDFQERFLEAYAKNEVPQIDYFNLEDYDWPAVVKWASTELDFSPSERVPDLPATREQFDSVFELREEPLTAGDELFQSVHGVTINKKRSLMAQNPFSIPLEDPSPKSSRRKEELAKLENAKTWVRANVITPEKTYRPNEAKDILELFGESLITNATQMLINERVISSTNRGRIAPGRNYDISENFLQILSRKRGIETTQLRQASHFKCTVLDPELQQTGTADVSYSADDGDILALINLYASGHIQLQPQDAPRNKFGLTDGGYLTRQMDKKLLRFPVKIIPTKSYVPGNPVKDKAALAVLPPAPTKSGPGLPPMTPLWYDMNGELESRLWNMAIGPVIGGLVMRPGLNAHVLASMIKHIMGAWEITLILQWMKEVGIVKPTSEGEPERCGWRLQESWWMVSS
ncbi:unnamed protein product [Penicillium olsonii]|uniref:TFIIIC transcription initiation factor complex subunits Tfc3 n=1 Tax=Penicillium olsonii TaxID=99116 RepID=A0A9W4MV26_PENOL|nr:unnamed protein product [Penicillium olsonii]CAG8168914.1 unnamed protein product [Penicillium olsonii]